MSENKALPHLNAVELRVLGSLIEKSRTTPDYYPMTLNALTAACNQKSSRKPVVDYSEETVQSALNSLKGQSLVSVAVGGTSRSTKYKHNFTTLYPLTNPELAILCLLFLRGAQTPGELNSNSGRLHEFQSLESVYETLQKLGEADPPFVKELSRRPGQKETRFVHLLGEYVDDQGEGNSEEKPTENNVSIDQRLTALEQEVLQLRETILKISKELYGT